MAMRLDFKSLFYLKTSNRRREKKPEMNVEGLGFRRENNDSFNFI